MTPQHEKMRDLFEDHKNDTAELAKINARIKATEKEMTEIAAPLFNEKLKQDGKTHGSFKMDIFGITMQCEVKKTVKWDSGKLADVAKKIPSADAAQIFTATLSISEDEFQSLTEFEHPALGEIILAREVKYSAVSAKPVKGKSEESPHT